MELWLMLLLGLIIGLAIAGIWTHLHIVFGRLQIDNSDPEKDTYRLIINDLDCLSKKKYVLMKIDKNTDLSQK